MTTAYTEGVDNGCSFEDFVWRCARAMSPLIFMRDEPLSAPIPRKLEPSTYYRDRLWEAKKELKKVKRLSLRAAADCSMKEHRKLGVETQRERELAVQRCVRFQEMLIKVADWTPPTQYHTKLQLFMLEQLRYDAQPPSFASIPVPLTGDQWKKSTIDRLRLEISNCERLWQNDLEIAAKTNKWLDNLRASVPQP